MRQNILINVLLRGATEMHLPYLEVILSVPEPSMLGVKRAKLAVELGGMRRGMAYASSPVNDRDAGQS